MMRLFYSILLTLLIGANTYSQDDSKLILDKVASINNGYKTFKVDFKFTPNTNEPAGQSKVESGRLQIKGNKYHLTLSNSDIVFDGKSIYNYLKEPNEINITKPEPSKVDNGEFFFSNPRDI